MRLYALSKKEQHEISELNRNKIKNESHLSGYTEIVCKVCGEKKIIRLSRLTDKNYCSLDCYWKDKKGSVNLKMRGKNHPNWKGNNATYSTLHEWIRKKRGKASNYKCEDCGKQARDWANIYHTYSRNLEEYVPLCRKCHIDYDKHNNL